MSMESKGTLAPSSSIYQSLNHSEHSKQKHINTALSRHHLIDQLLMLLPVTTTCTLLTGIIVVKRFQVRQTEQTICE